EARLAMGLPSLALECDVRRQRQVPGCLSPDEIKGVACKPHVAPAAGHGVITACGIVTSGASAARSAHVRASFEHAKGRVAGVGSASRRHENKAESEVRGHDHGRLLLQDPGGL